MRRNSQLQVGFTGVFFIAVGVVADISYAFVNGAYMAPETSAQSISCIKEEGKNIFTVRCVYSQMLCHS